MDKKKRCLGEIWKSNSPWLSQNASTTVSDIEQKTEARVKRNFLSPLCLGDQWSIEMPLQPPSFSRFLVERLQMLYSHGLSRSTKLKRKLPPVVNRESQKIEVSDL